MICLCIFLTVVSCSKVPEQPPQKTYDEQKELYADIIARYTELLNAKNNGSEVVSVYTDAMDDSAKHIEDTLVGTVNAARNDEKLKELGYGFKDLDGNGTPELLLLTKYATVHAFFTLSNDLPVLLESAYGDTNECTFTLSGYVFVPKHSDDGNKFEYYVYHLDHGELVCDSVFGKQRKDNIEYFKIVDGETVTIDENAFLTLQYQYGYPPTGDYGQTKKLLSPRIYLPLANIAADHNTPIADFSSYVAILETFKAILNLSEDFNRLAWVSGEYDNLFSFPNDISYEYYNRFLRYARTFSLDLGYDEVDLNGDGVDELLLLNEDYAIRAIFTQKNGVPVMLYGLDHSFAWIDELGYIHVDNEESYDLTYSLYEFSKDGEFKQIYSIRAVSNGYFFAEYYLTRDGRPDVATYEQCRELLNEYRCYSEPFEPNEQTRNVTKLSYTPINETSEDPVKSALSELWYKSATLEKTTGNEYGAYGQTYIRFGDMKDSKVEVDFKYVYLYYTPDPERENYAIDNTEKSYLSVTARLDDGFLLFDENGIKGRIEIGTGCVWLVIEERTDSRFAVGYHCLDKYEDSDYRPPFSREE